MCVLVGWSGTPRCPCLHHCRLWSACFAKSAVLLPLIVAKHVFRQVKGKQSTFAGVYELSDVRPISIPTTRGEVTLDELKTFEFKSGGITLNKFTQLPHAVQLRTKAIPIGQEVKEALRVWRLQFGTSPFTNEVHEDCLVDLMVARFT